MITEDSGDGFDPILPSGVISRKLLIIMLILFQVELEGHLKTLSEEKDRALLKIDSTFETHVHVLSRRATLLKNNVIDVYNEHVAALESDLEEISTAMTCVVSLKVRTHTALRVETD